MKRIGIIILSFFLLSSLIAQECKNTFESNYLKLSICNDLDWNIEQVLPYIKIKTPDVATFITIISEPYEGKETSKEFADKAFKLDQETYPTIQKVNEENIKLDGVIGTLYTAKVPDKSNQTTTFIMVNNGRKFTINNNCYSNCESAEQAVKSVINKTTFQKIEEPKLTEKEIKDFEKFKLDLHSAFQSGKVKTFEKLLVDQSLMLELIETKMKDETMKQRFSSIIKNNWKEFSKEFVAKSKESYEKLIAKGGELGIDWKKIELISVDYKLESTIPGIISAKCKYVFSFQGKKYKITIDSVEPLKGGWYISKMNTSYIKEE
jgi:hypothetical protein